MQRVYKFTFWIVVIAVVFRLIAGEEAHGDNMEYRNGVSTKTCPDRRDPAKWTPWGQKRQSYPQAHSDLRRYSIRTRGDCYLPTRNPSWRAA